MWEATPFTFHAVFISQSARLTFIFPALKCLLYLHYVSPGTDILIKAYTSVDFPVYNFNFKGSLMKDATSRVALLRLILESPLLISRYYLWVLRQQTQKLDLYIKWKTLVTNKQ